MVTETTATGRESDKFMLRLPDGMRDRLKELAKSNNRTLNAEIVSRLDASLAISESTPSIDQAQTMGSEPWKDEFRQEYLRLSLLNRYLDLERDSHQLMHDLSIYELYAPGLKEDVGNPQSMAELAVLELDHKKSNSKLEALSLQRLALMREIEKAGFVLVDGDNAQDMPSLLDAPKKPPRNSK